ncbi:MAG: helix-turn-helix transcriptional regulator [Deltaproteobacteria bacterium]|nr:helix-turn-helix transcriptional regulator [Deltaproteobacteria bacterium]
MKNLSEKIIHIRAQANLSRDKFAKTLEYSKSYITDIETGRTKPSRRLLEAISRVYSVSIDWLLSDSYIIDLIEDNKNTENPNIIFIYAFTQKGIDDAEIMLKELLEEKKFIFVDASGLKTYVQFLKKLFNRKDYTGQISDKLLDQLKDMMLNEKIILIIKNMSLSKITRSGGHIRDIFKIMDDSWDVEGARKGGQWRHLKPQSSLIILDFPSYLEKNINTFGYYAVPIYARRPNFGYVK